MTIEATYAQTELVNRIEQLAGAELASLTRSQLDAIDQFHAGGADAVELILPTLDLSPGMSVLDVGSGHSRRVGHRGGNRPRALAGLERPLRVLSVT